MGVTGIPVEEFLNIVKAGKVPVFDVRSESEFAHAHLPGSINVPILNDGERKEVGTIYKQQGREAAVETGFRQVGPRFFDIIRKVKDQSEGREVLLYCWRGGMRSQIMAWLLQMNGYRIVTLKGGYKSFRNWVLDMMNRPLKTIVLGGPTGSGKTGILDQIKNKGAQVLPLETLANHKGSAFGALGMKPQPSNEQFENFIAMEWSSFDASLPVWVENESRTIGSCMIPEPLFNRIRTSELIEIIVGDARRKKRILDEYGIFPTEVLSEITLKISRRMGPQHARHANQLLAEGDMNGWLEIVLDYYDKLYAFGSSQRNQDKCFRIDLSDAVEDQFADKILAYSEEIITTPINTSK
jgi:tRNA 2-selenouridine synthase